ncbi:MAG: DUF4388 domain-containing protein [Chloroflexota bacterium]|nr:DUF4388 domain-containing protein [Chloroflexota bacterium]
MPLQGNLRDFSTTQLLNLINLAGKTGTLTIFEGLPTNEKDAMGGVKMAAGKKRASVAFKTGKLIHAGLDDQDGNLVSVLNKAGKLTSEQARIIKERAKNTSDKALALLLINANYVTQKDVLSSVQQHTLDIVYDLLGWHEGPFRFDDDALPMGDRIMVPIDLENVIIEGARRVQDDERLREEIPNLDVSLKFPEDAKEKYKGMHLSVEEWRIVGYVNPKNTIRQIAKANNMTDMEIRRVVYNLLQAGLVQMVKPNIAAQAAARQQEGRVVPKSPPVSASVINRIIDRIRQS